ncbi:MAG TPA: ATP-binding protein [Gemmatimonadales bacterium]|nr:ATP-binding protein [Gemmatimonadales bacterium]
MAGHRLGRELALRLWILSSLCWWGLGLPFSHLWWLLNERQTAWVLVCYAWQVPLLGWTGVVLLPWLRWRRILARLGSGDAAALGPLSRFPLTVASLGLATSTIGYAVGALQLRLIAALPMIEVFKIVVQGPVLGALVAVAGYLAAERAVHGLRLEGEWPALVGQGRSGPSLYAKVVSLIVAVFLAVTAPMILLLGANEQRHLERIRGEQLLGHLRELRDGAARIPLGASRLGRSTTIRVVDRGTGTVLAGPQAGRHVRALGIDHAERALGADGGGDEGWFVSRHGEHRVVAYTRLADRAGGTGRVVLAVAALGDDAPELASRQRAAALLGLLTLGLGVALAMAAARSVSHPVERLIAAASAMAGGLREIGTVAMTGGDEVAALAREFDRMARRIRADEQRLVQAERLSAVGRFVSGIAHQVNNPLAAILHFSEQLLASPDLRPGDREALETIQAQAVRSRAIIRDLLAFVRERRETRTPIDLRGLVTDAATTARREAAASGARVSIELPEGLEPVRADRGGLEQVLANLIVNGMEAAGAGGTVVVRVDREADATVIAVEDDGPGIPPEVLPWLFEPFFTTKPHGTGLGLAAAFGIVRQHGGTITAENRAEGRGARFVVRLPRPPDAVPPPIAVPPTVEPAPAEAAPPVAGAGGRTPPMPRTVLLIDDEPSIRAALRRHLERAGWRVDEAADGSEALQKLLAAPPDRYAALVTDLKMPGISGIEVHDRLARERPDLFRRMLVTTGDVASPEVARLLARTDRPVLEKPFELAALDRAIAAVSGGAAAPQA